MAVVQIADIAETRRSRHRVKGGRARRVHQHLIVEIPDLKGNLRFIGMAVDPRLRLAQGLIEGLIQIGVFLAGHGHTHDAL
ncbi:hypothetical protein D3C84_1185680 [compost metagenome]